MLLHHIYRVVASEAVESSKIKLKNVNQNKSQNTCIPRYYHGTTTTLPRHYHVIATSLPRHHHVITTSLPRPYHVITTILPRYYHGASKLVSEEAFFPKLFEDASPQDSSPNTFPELFGWASRRHSCPNTSTVPHKQPFGPLGVQSVQGRLPTHPPPEHFVLFKRFLQFIRMFGQRPYKHSSPKTLTSLFKAFECRARKLRGYLLLLLLLLKIMLWLLLAEKLICKFGNSKANSVVNV